MCLCIKISLRWEWSLITTPISNNIEKLHLIKCLLALNRDNKQIGQSNLACLFLPFFEALAFFYYLTDLLGCVTTQHPLRSSGFVIPMYII